MTLEEHKAFINATPRTDAVLEIASIEDRYRPLLDLARELERELRDLMEACAPPKTPTTTPEEIAAKAECARVVECPRGVHDWQPDGGVVWFETHLGAELPHLHTTCSKCKAQMWWNEYQWEKLSNGCSADAVAVRVKCDRCGADYGNDNGRFTHPFSDIGCPAACVSVLLADTVLNVAVPTELAPGVRVRYLAGSGYNTAGNGLGGRIGTIVKPGAAPDVWCVRVDDFPNPSDENGGLWGARRSWVEIIGGPDVAPKMEDHEFELRLLKAAKCPNCDNSGTTRHGDECEWCFHRKRAVAALDVAPEGHRP